MVEDETNLSVCIQKLRLVPRSKPVKIYRDEDPLTRVNPFARKCGRVKSPSHVSLFGPTCVCRKKRAHNTKVPLKAKNKLLREPLIVVNRCTHIAGDAENVGVVKHTSAMDEKLFGDECGSSQPDFKSIIAGCEQLSLTSDSDAHNFSEPTFRELRHVASQRADKPVTSSCSQQAMARLCVNPPCDVTIDELASYFETLVHIPKKMSSMAEMMYI